jgi:uncharacterized protein
MNHAISWFEIPATDINRAQQFYEAILNIKMQAMDYGSVKMRLFPIDDPMNGVGGAIVDNGGFTKSSLTDGVLIYLNGNPDCQIVLDKVEAAGGKILVQKMMISPEYGDMAVIVDTEGNRIAFHNIPASMQK